MTSSTQLGEKPGASLTKTGRVRINDAEQLKKAIKDELSTIDMGVKKRDFEHLHFNPRSAERILQFVEFVDANL